MRPAPASQRPIARALALVALALSALSPLAACTDEEGIPGTPLASGLGRGLLVAPGGGAAAFLLDAAHPDDRTVPDDLVAGDLWLAQLGADARARKVGAGVPSIPGVAAFSAHGEALAFLSEWRFRTGEGTLFVAATGQEPRQLAEVASSFTWAPQGLALAYVSRGRLQVLEAPLTPGGKTQAQDGVQTFEWSPDGKRLAARAPTLAGGKLVVLDLGSGARTELGPSTDFAFASDGALAFLGPTGPRGGDRTLSIVQPAGAAPRELGRATAFAFSPDGKRLGILSTDRSPGDAFGDLAVLAASGGPAAKLGSKVSEWHFTPRGDLLLLSGYDLRSRAGALVFAAAAGGAPVELARGVQSFQTSPSGDRVLYIAQKADRTDFKLELWSGPLPPLPASPPRKIDEGVYGFLLSPDGATLFWKSRCNGSRSCALYRAPTSGASAPVMIAKEVAGFDLSDDGKRLLVAHPHKRAARAVDLAVLDAQAPPLDPPARPFALELSPDARFTDAKGTHVVAARLSAHQPKVVWITLP